ncbi:Serine carboxypeptidase-like 2 [Frankliniella fusca]|uniref:Serine carboxypeptidase-like 2 n=1 Tax=Frankliniella fusca TaxID=407009 RepID=A0AAE1HLK4_9NEOP|nr:Serine carboxypeptidase-like 2 [Frankliniella fusca]
MAVRRLVYHYSNVVIVLLALSCSEERYIKSAVGPYIVVLKNVYNCEAYEQLAWSIKARISHFKPAHPFEPTRITGNVTGTVPLDDSLVSSFILDRRSNNQWKENALVINFPKGTGCSSIFVNGPYIASLLGDLYSPSPCKVQPGFHTFADMPVKIQHPNVPVFAYGEYRLHFLLSNIGKTHEPLLCYSGEVNLIPKP